MKFLYTKLTIELSKSNLDKARLDITLFFKGETSSVFALYRNQRFWINLITVLLLPEDFNSHNRHGAFLCFFEISPHHNVGFCSGLKWPKVRATLREHKRYFLQIPAIIFAPLPFDWDILRGHSLWYHCFHEVPNIAAESPWNERDPIFWHFQRVAF